MIIRASEPPMNERRSLISILRMSLTFPMNVPRHILGSRIYQH
jgi:hypothetical protein